MLPHSLCPLCPHLVFRNGVVFILVIYFICEAPSGRLGAAGSGQQAPGGSRHWAAAGSGRRQAPGGGRLQAAAGSGRRQALGGGRLRAAAGSGWHESFIHCKHL